MSVTPRPIASHANLLNQFNQSCAYDCRLGCLGQTCNACCHRERHIVRPRNLPTRNKSICRRYSSCTWGTLCVCVCVCVCFHPMSSQKESIKLLLLSLKRTRITPSLNQHAPYMRAYVCEHSVINQVHPPRTEPWSAQRLKQHKGHA